MTSRQRRTRTPLLPPSLTALTAAAVLLTGCGTERPAGEDGGSPTAAGAPATAGSPGATVLSRTDIEKRARWMGSAIELIYVAEVPGFERAQQSVGVHGGDGFSAMYVDASGGGMVQLSVDRGTLDEENCERTPLASGGGGGDGGKVTCERDGDAWYRTSGDAHEYARPEGGHVVRLTADRESAGRDILRRAAEEAHPADDLELDALLPPLPDTGSSTGGGPGGEGAGGADGGGQQPERGDLPPEGDGAPNNDVDAGG
ncbi:MULTISPECIES: hypothetical protein [Streptomyces]|uniref:Uncharacterized protein n=1 Tax=Streptomyces fradiae TaxID=1906 RepID=A0ACC4WCD7_STRFR|nr:MULTISPECIES: hypothetical protein [Streptomyces]KNE82143.1 hypothetical protein ADZ36_12450 [Streptomyces fradiae]OFA56533.1 hypothetical protein BEN35_06215 [Streptomyces fradiae]